MRAPIRWGIAAVEVDRHAAHLVLGQEVGGSTAAGLLLKIEIAERLPVLVTDDEAASVISSTVQGGGKRRLDIQTGVFHNLCTGNAVLMRR